MPSAPRGPSSAAAVAAALALAAPLACQWQQAAPSTSPGSLAAPAMAGAPNGSILLFGGRRAVSPTPFSDDTWRWTGDWAQLPVASGPSGRSEARLVYDLTRSVHVLYGGWNSVFSIGSAIDETWEFNGVTWSQVTPLATPGGLWKHAMCFDPVRGRTVAFGGATSGLVGASAQTWEYDGATWTQITTVGTPGPRENAAMCFDASIGRCLLFGGADPLVGANNQLWLYDGASWIQVPQVATWPSARAGAELVFHPGRGVSILTGGVDNIGNALADTWEFDGLMLTWTPRPPAGAAGRDFGLAFDAAAQLAVRYGGSGVPGQTWLYGANTRSFGAGCSGSAGVPSLAAPAPPRLGQTYALQLTNLVPTVPVAVLVLSLAETPPTPLGGIGMPGCSGYVTPDLFVAVAGAAGAATWSGAIPGTPTLLGTSLYAQGLSLDPGFNPAGLTTSNAHEGLLGL